LDSDLSALRELKTMMKHEKVMRGMKREGDDKKNNGREDV
jgi:hypothetical protein